MNILLLLRNATIVQLCGSSLSLIASTTIILMATKWISRFKSWCTRQYLKLKSELNDVSELSFEGNDRANCSHHKRKEKEPNASPYSRLIVSLSISDVMQSLAMLLGPFVPPKGTLQSPWAVGNTSSCDAAGIIMYAGNLAYPLYIFAISIYFYCRLTKQMTGDEFRNKVERKVHFLISTFVAITSLAALFTQSINTIPSGSLCQIASIPAGCRDNPNYECERGQMAFPFIIITNIVSLFSIIGVIVMMTMMCLNILYRQRVTYGSTRRSSQASSISNRRSSIEFKVDENSAHQQDEEGYLLLRCIPLLAIFRNRQPGETDSMYISRIRVAEMVTQAFLYVLSFFSTFVFAWVASVYYLAGGSPPLWTLYPFAWLYSSGGFLNMLVFTRPKVKILRMRYSDLGWFHAFYLVIKEGGEVPELEDEFNEENQNDNESCNNQDDGNLAHASSEHLRSSKDDSTRIIGKKESRDKSNRLEAIKEDEEDDDSELGMENEKEDSADYKKKLEYYSRLRN